MKLSLVIPSIRPEHWDGLLSEMKLSCQNHDFEIIFVGPYTDNCPAAMSSYQVKYVKDYGCPSRCVQIGGEIAEGEYVAWASDDCQICVNAFDEAIELADAKFTSRDGMLLRYSEGANYEGTQHDDPLYWIARTHTDLRLPGVDERWKIAPIAMYRTNIFKGFGGLNCAFEHINFNTHDLAFRLQARGGIIYDSPSRVFKFDWQPEKKDYAPILSAFVANDRPLFAQMYSNPRAAYDGEVDYENWKRQPNVWKRRFS